MEDRYWSRCQRPTASVTGPTRETTVLRVWGHFIHIYPARGWATWVWGGGGCA